MSKTYDMIAESLQELINDYETTGGKNLSHDKFRISLEPAKVFTAEDVRNIRTRNHLTQSLLAKFLCVSKKTVEAWESGRNRPNGPSRRLLELLDKNNVAVTASLALQ
ncbi:helix-turn-helix domain-containing protein [uncultured Selenomonas sp.]|uniref:helix-turn-helix domain-containing protein n=1 Tax=uncultured Selenomonas sp. TaxID=159275 RepID=UPI0025E2AE95|nr:helix-turn-helix domain-containing protein [uncultured Selenomonas sp.]